jgi:hypothetical protein
MEGAEAKERFGSWSQHGLIIACSEPHGPLSIR